MNLPQYEKIKQTLNMTLTCFSFTKPYLTHICKTHIYLTPTLPDEESDNDDSTCSGIEIIDTASYARLRTTIVISRDKCNAFTSLWVVGKVYYRVMHHCVYTRYMCWYAVLFSRRFVCRSSLLYTTLWISETGFTQYRSTQWFSTSHRHTKWF